MPVSTARTPLAAASLSPFAPMLRRYVHVLGVPADRGDDLVQEVFVAVLQKAFEDRGEEAVGALLRAVARHVVLRSRRGEAARREVELAHEVWCEDGGDRNGDERVDALRTCIEALPERSRELLRGAYQEEIGRVALARRLGLRPEGVKTALRRLRGAFVRAAIVLLGVLVTVAVAWHRYADEVPLQQPASYEPPLIPGRVPLIQDAAKLANLPDTQAAFHLQVRPDSDLARDASPLARFSGLRSLHFLGPVDWREGVLTQVAALPRLEVLTITLGANCPPARLRELREARSLRHLTLFLARALGPDDVKALAALPALAVLTLNNGALDAATVRALSTLPKLDALTLHAVDGCREDVLVELRTLHRLRQLELIGMGTPRWPGAAGRDSVGLTPRVAQALQSLPLFESLLLRSSAVSVAAIEALPKGLQRIGIRSIHAGAEVFAALRRFPDLRCLDLAGGGRDTLWRGGSGDPAIEAWIEQQLRDAPPREAVWAAQAELLRETPARALRYYGPVPEPVREALRGVPLTSLWLERSAMDWGGDIDVAAALPELQELTLQTGRVTLEQLRPLAALAKLRQLTLRFGIAAELADVRALLPKVTVVTHGL